jgi:DNA invertase Pin-like site-specific DNA recombinase
VKARRCAQSNDLPAVAEEFIEGAGQCAVPLPARPAGQQLLARLERGDTLVVAAVEVLGVTLSASLLALTRLRDAGVQLRVAGQPVCPYEILPALEEMKAFDRRSRSEAIKAGLKRARRVGKRTCRHAPAGSRVVHRAGGMFLEPDRDELAVIARIVAWRNRGFSWGQIEAHLLRCGVHTSNGLDWDRRRLQTTVKSVEEGRLVIPADILALAGAEPPPRVTEPTPTEPAGV